MSQTDQKPQARRTAVRPATPADLRGMARCHRACFPDQFISRMGLRFAAAFYGAYLRHLEGIAFVAVDADSGEVAGVVAGGNPDIRAELLHWARRRFPFPLRWRALFDHVVRARVLGTVANKLGMGEDSVDRESTDWPAPSGRWAKLQVICVHAGCRGGGAAAQLMECFRQACRQAGYPTMDLSVYTDNTRAVAFYRKSGWQVVKDDGGTTFMRCNLA
jgi:ribosomal protein S18 acetylase RimI-like enzyme